MMRPKIFVFMITVVFLLGACTAQPNDSQMPLNSRPTEKSFSEPNWYQFMFLHLDPSTPECATFLPIGYPKEVRYSFSSNSNTPKTMANRIAFDTEGRITEYDLQSDGGVTHSVFIYTGGRLIRALVTGPTGKVVHEVQFQYFETDFFLGCFLNDLVGGDQQVVVESKTVMGKREGFTYSSFGSAKDGRKSVSDSFFSEMKDPVLGATLFVRMVPPGQLSYTRSTLEGDKWLFESATPELGGETSILELNKSEAMSGSLFDVVKLQQRKLDEVGNWILLDRVEGSIVLHSLARTIFYY